MPEGDTIAWAANRIRPVLCGRVPDQVLVHERFSMDRWPERLAGRAVVAVDTHGKHLFLRFDGGLVLHSHLGMVGSWFVRSRAVSGAWIQLRADGHWVAQVRGPTLELLTSLRARRFAQLGPDVLAPSFDAERFLARLRDDDQSRPIGDALLDQRNVAGIGNIWKSEGCWEAGVDPWRVVRSVSDSEALAVINAVRPRMLDSAARGPRAIEPRVYRRSGRPCPRCAERVLAHGQGDANRATYWCPGCQR